MTDKKWKILVTEQVGEAGLKLLREAPDVELFEEPGIKRDEILKRVAEMDGILTRSGTRMDKEMLDAGVSLKVVGRAGVGVDNIDLPEASRRGIIVINAPTGNTLAATELTMSVMLGVMRKVPQAFASVQAGCWERSKFMGRQLSGRKLLIIGLGRIGSNIAVRARAFGMSVMAYDPYISKRRAESLNVPLAENLADAVSLADVVTIHTPLTEETTNMIDRDLLKAFKPGAYLINCARGGLVEEEAVVEALRDGRLAGFATDVYPEEPMAADHPFHAGDLQDRVILTPHIGANTVEAQSEVSRIAASNMLAALRGQAYEHAVNLPFMEQTLNATQRAFVNLARKMGVLGAKIAEAKGASVHRCHVMMRGSQFLDEEPAAAGSLRPYSIAFLKGLLEVSHGPEVNYMLAPILARDRHLDVDEGVSESRTYKNLLEITLETDKGPLDLFGTITEEGRQRLVKVSDYWVDFVPRGRLFVFQNHDRPGVIGSIGRILGERQVNIANFSLGRKDGSGLALGILEIDDKIPAEAERELSQHNDMVWSVQVDL